MTTTVIIPTKNEVIGVRKIMPQLNLEWADEWIVMDGNSNDGTGFTHTDSTSNSNNGTLTNMDSSDWVMSSFNLVD